MIRPEALIQGRYRVGRRLGDGGMSVVFLGHDLLLGRDVAIKTPRPQFTADPAFRARFEREARAAASLAHPNIIDVYDVGEHQGTPYIIMELVRGQPLKAIIATEAPFHPDDVAALLEQIAAALDYAHSRGYIHRDIKPGNILIDEHGRARVVDFGIAKGLADADLTETGAGLGTAGYLSPEQAAGLMATPASDLYAAGVVAFEMLTGRLPFAAETPLGVAMRHIQDPAPAPSAIVPGIPEAVDAIVLRALEKDPTRRWPSVGAFARALRTWRDAATPSRAHTGPTSAARPRGSLLPTVVVALIVLGALSALLWTGFRGMPETAGGSLTPALAPAAPTITGGMDPDAPRPEEIAPPIVPDAADAARAAPEEVVEGPGAPTIAPADNAAVVVPNLQGLTVAGTTEALLPLGLRVAQDQPVFTSSVPLNAVARQEPAPGSSVPPGTVVRISLSRGPSPFPVGAP